MVGLQHSPLEGVRVLDLTRVLAGPFATSLLADMGADVIKVENPADNDREREAGPLVQGVSIHFANVNRNKRSVAIDLRADQGRELFLSLAEHADVVVENFRPGVMERLGLSYAALSERNSRIIMCSISGFGQMGSNRDRPAYDVIVQALSGAMSVTGEPGRDPVRLGIPMGDLAGGVYGALGILAALHDRSVTGRGQLVDVGMLDALTNLMAYYPTDYLNVGLIAEPVGGRHHHVAPYGVVPARDGHMVIAIYDNRFWRLFCTALDRPDLMNDDRFATRSARLENREPLYEIVESVMVTKTKAEWSKIFEDLQIPFAPVMGVDEVATSQFAEERELFVNLDYPGAGRVVVPGRAVKFPHRAPLPLVPAPGLGEDGADVLQELLGMSPEDIGALRDARVVL